MGVSLQQVTVVLDVHWIQVISTLYYIHYIHTYIVCCQKDDSTHINISIFHFHQTFWCLSWEADRRRHLALRAACKTTP